MNKTAAFLILMLLLPFACGEVPAGTDPESFTIHFHRPGFWTRTNNVQITYSAGTLPVVLYPGVEMQSNGDDWFSYTFSPGEAGIVSFNDGLGINSFGELYGFMRTNTGWFVQPEMISNTPPAGAPAASGTFSVYFKKPAAWTGTPHIWYWKTQHSVTYGDCGDIGVAEPGSAMADTGDATWYSFDFSAMGTKTRLRINDGVIGGKQTFDMTCEGHSWITMGNEQFWYDAMPSQ